MTDKVKYTRAARALDAAATKGTPLEAPLVPAPTWVPRLSFKQGPRTPASEAQLVDSLAKAEQAAIFLDGSVAGRTIDVPLWSELLRHPGRLHLIERVWKELLPHFAKVPDHPLADAVRARNPAVVPYDEPHEGPRLDTLLYYVNLLATRRKQLERSIARYEREHGHAPDDDALTAINAEYQQTFGERGVLLAKKPISPLITDEILVLLAVEYAVSTGQPTVILSTDPDVEEQFMKMIELLTMHYWGMLIAREYLADFTRFKPRTVPAERAAATKLFTSATLLDLGGRRIQDFRPQKIEFVPISCVLIGEYVSQLTYGAETAMREVLDIKAKTGGRSTDLLGERDLHAYFVPEIPGERRDYQALITDDVREPIGGTSMSLAKLDCLMAINTRLNMSRVAAMPASTRILLPVPKRWRRS